MSIVNTVTKTYLYCNGKVLLLQRSSSDIHRPSKYDIPGGAVDAGESIQAALIREVQEETGLLITPKMLQEITGFGVSSNESAVEKHVYIARQDMDAEPQVRLSQEHESYIWLSPQDALETFRHPFYGAALSYAIRAGYFQ